MGSVQSTPIRGAINVGRGALYGQRHKTVTPRSEAQYAATFSAHAAPFNPHAAVPYPPGGPYSSRLGLGKERSGKEDTDSSLLALEHALAIDEDIFWYVHQHLPLTSSGRNLSFLCQAAFYFPEMCFFVCVETHLHF